MTEPQHSTSGTPRGWDAAPTAAALADPPPGHSAYAPSWAGGPAAQRPSRSSAPRPPWFWPVVAVGIGVAALLAGGGAGFAIGHAIGTHQSQSPVPGGAGNGTGTSPFGGQGGTGTGTNPFGGRDGTGSDPFGGSQG